MHKKISPKCQKKRKKKRYLQSLLKAKLFSAPAALAFVFLLLLTAYRYAAVKVDRCACWRCWRVDFYVSLLLACGSKHGKLTGAWRFFVGLFYLLLFCCCHSCKSTFEKWVKMRSNSLFISRLRVFLFVCHSDLQLAVPVLSLSLPPLTHSLASAVNRCDYHAAFSPFFLLPALVHL